MIQVRAAPGLIWMGWEWGGEQEVSRFLEGS